MYPYTYIPTKYYIWMKYDLYFDQSYFKYWIPYSQRHTRFDEHTTKASKLRFSVWKETY